MAEHPNAAMARTRLEALGKGDFSKLADSLADDVVWHEIGNPEPVRGKAALAARMTGGNMGFDITGTVHDVVANDDHTVALVSAKATKDGKTLEYNTAEIYHVRDGKVVERWAFSDDTEAITRFFA